MPYHSIIVGGAKLRTPEADVHSPSRFVEEAKRLDGFVDAFRTLGRYDAVVFLHADTVEATMRSVLELRRIEGVVDVECWVGAPGPHHAHEDAEHAAKTARASLP